MRFLNRSPLVAVASFFLTVVWGCSTAPVGPRATSIPDPVFYQADPVGKGSAGTASEGLVDGTLGAVTTVVTRTVDGALGGIVRSGDWELEIPAGAFSGRGTITMTPDPNNGAICELRVTPESKNAFRVPVKLRFQVRTGADLANDVLWWDPDAKTWRVVTSSRDKTTKTLTADLTHFSKYAVGKPNEGKAGW